MSKTNCSRPTLLPDAHFGARSRTVTQGNLPDRKSDALRALGLSWVMLDCETRSLKIRVFSVFVGTMRLRFLHFLTRFDSAPGRCSAVSTCGLSNPASHSRMPTSNASTERCDTNGSTSTCSNRSSMLNRQQLNGCGVTMPNVRTWRQQE